MTESGKKNQKLVEEAFKKIEKTALNGISEEEQKLFMEIFLPDLPKSCRYEMS